LKNENRKSKISLNSNNSPTIKTRFRRFFRYEEKSFTPTHHPPVPRRRSLLGLQQRCQYAQTQPQRLQLPHLLTAFLVGELYEFMQINAE
jgi:hypothetical protein